MTEEEAGAAVRAVVQLISRWKLSAEEARLILGGLPDKTWKDDCIDGIDQDCATRLSLLLGIHAATRSIFGDDRQRAYAWISAPNVHFDGRSALEVMKCGGIPEIYRVREYLGGVCDAGERQSKFHEENDHPLADVMTSSAGASWRSS